MHLGALIQKRRKQIGMTQKELAKDICAQATISKIELGYLMPSSELLKQIANRLGVSILYFYEDSENMATDWEVENLIEKVKLALNQTEYEQVARLLEQNQELLDALYDINQIHYFKMIRAYIDFYIKDKKEEALHELESLLMNEQISQHLKIDVLSHLGIIYYKEKDFSRANKYYEKAINLFDQTTPFKLKARILLNYALNLEDLDQDEKALEAVIDGIDLLLENQSLYILGHFHAHKAYLFSKLGNLDEAIKAYETAVLIFDLLNYTKLHAFVSVNLTELKAKRREMWLDEEDME